MLVSNNFYNNVDVSLDELEVFNFHEIQGPINLIPNELIVEIFLNLNLTTIGRVCCTIKNWKKLAYESDVWKTAIYREVAFTNAKWAEQLGENAPKGENDEEEFSSLPWREFLKDRQKFESIFPEKKPNQILMLVRISKNFNLQFFKDLLKDRTDIWDPIAKKVMPLDKSCWILMTMSNLPEGTYRKGMTQEEIDAKLALSLISGYEIVGALESYACILSKFADSNLRLFMYNKECTRCKEVVYNKVVVGFSFYDDKSYRVKVFTSGDSFGAAVMRKF